MYVVAPDRDRSGISAAMTLLDVVRAHPVSSPVDGVEAHAVEGTPADCVILAHEGLYDEPFDIILSGINQGANMGADVLLSGTVGRCGAWLPAGRSLGRGIVLLRSRRVHSL